jgi:hypothetical protein
MTNAVTADDELDSAWLSANLQSLSAWATDGFGDLGKGALLLDRRRSNVAPSVYYIPESEIDQHDEETLRMVREYDPGQHLVVMFLLSGNRTNSFQLGLKGRSKEANFSHGPAAPVAGSIGPFGSSTAAHLAA